MLPESLHAMLHYLLKDLSFRLTAVFVVLIVYLLILFIIPKFHVLVAKSYCKLIICVV